MCLPIKAESSKYFIDIDAVQNKYFIIFISILHINTTRIHSISIFAEELATQLFPQVAPIPTRVAETIQSTNDTMTTLSPRINSWFTCLWSISCEPTLTMVGPGGTALTLTLMSFSVSDLFLSFLSDLAPLSDLRESFDFELLFPFSLLSEDLFFLSLGEIMSLRSIFLSSFLSLFEASLSLKSKDSLGELSRLLEDDFCFLSLASLDFLSDGESLLFLRGESLRYGDTSLLSLVAPVSWRRRPLGVCSRLL